MASDNLWAILGMIRAELGDQVPDEAWEKIHRMIAAEASGARIYVPKQPKRSRLDALAAADAGVSSDQLARILGVSVRRAQQLRKLR